MLGVESVKEEKITMARLARSLKTVSPIATEIKYLAKQTITLPY